MSSPTVRRRRLGALLREQRERAGMTGGDAASRLGWSVSKVSRIEGAQRGTSAADVQALLDVYGVEGDERAAIVDLARRGRERGWWAAYDDVLGGRAYVAFEAEATRINIWQPLLVPGLLQTAGYAAALFRSNAPRPSEEEVGRSVQMRITRQTVLERETPLELRAIIGEAALRTDIGGREVMREQIDKLILAATRRHITVQVVPAAAGAHPGLAGAFMLFEFDDGAEPIAYAPAFETSVYHDEADDIASFQACFATIEDRATGPRDTIDLLGQIRDAL